MANLGPAIDGFRVRVSRPLGGENEVNTQALVYNKWIKVHNILFQNVTSPYGLIVDFSGPYLGKGNDLVALRDSDVLNRFRLALIAAGLDPVDLTTICLATSCKSTRRTFAACTRSR